MSNHTVGNWLQLHRVDAPAISGLLSAFDATDDPVPVSAAQSVRALLPEEVWSLTSMAHAEALPELSDDIAFITERCGRVFDASPAELPRTRDLGEGQTPVISMSYKGTAADMLCIAHEFGHALQYHLVQGRFIPPVLRELAAFTAERVFLDFVRRNRCDLDAPLRSAWHSDNQVYFGRYAEHLQDALRNPNTPYRYWMNYPVARCLVGGIFKDTGRACVSRVFAAEISISDLHSKLGEPRSVVYTKNSLPEVSDPECESPAVSAYRSLGMMALLDIDCRQSKSEQTIEDYYAARLAHMQSRTVFVAIGNAQKPIGYATWDIEQADANAVRLKHRTAPFGDHESLLEQLRTHLPENTDVLPHHSRGAGSEQVAW